MKTTRIAVLCFAVLWSAGCDKNPLSTGLDVTYSVTGTARADITFQTSADSTAQGIDQVLPWTWTLNGAKQGDFVYVSAQKGAGADCVTAEIRVNKKVFESVRSCGPFATATATGTLK